MSNLECKHRLYKKVGLIGKAFSHEVRLELIELLSQCPQTVEKLSEMLDEDYKSISAHLRVLYRAGLVTCTRNGRFQRYGLASPKVAALAVMIRETAEQSLAAYCRGPYCFLAHEAAAILEASGRRLQVIPSGVMEWSSRGAELESASPEESQETPPRRGIRTKA